MSKSLFKSKTFWFNALTASAALTGVIQLAPEYTATIVGVINVLLRLVTEKPVHIA